MGVTIVEGADRADGPTFRERLQRELAARCTRSPRYSLRAFALDLGIDHSSLSQILRGRRAATPASIARLGQALGLTDAEIEACVQRERASPLPEAARRIADDVAAAIADPSHQALLELVRLDAFQPDVRWIARVLGIPADEVAIVLHRLLRLGLLRMEGPARWTAADEELVAGPIGFSRAALERLSRALEERPSDARVHSAVTLAVDSARVPEATARASRCREELARFLGEGVARDAVYRLEVHLYPLTRDPAATPVPPARTAR